MPAITALTALLPGAASLVLCPVSKSCSDESRARDLRVIGIIKVRERPNRQGGKEMVLRERRCMGEEQERGAGKFWRGRLAWRAAVLTVVAAVVAVAAVAAVRTGGGMRRVALEGPPRMVAELEKEARHDVEDDATKAGLKALNSKDSLAATLTGGLKTRIEDVDEGDGALLKKIMAKSGAKPSADTASAKKSKAAKKSAKKAVAAKEAASRNPKGSRGRAFNRADHLPPKPVISNVVAAVMRDRKREMMSMSKALARVALLRKQVQAREKEAAAVHGGGKGAVHPSKKAKDQKVVVKMATAKALLLKSAQLKKRASHVQHAALVKALPKERALDAAMAKQKAVLNKLLKEDKLANSKSKANAELAHAKTMSQQSIQELKLAGNLIKSSNAIGSKLTPKQTAKLQKKSENLTEKAVHTMLESRKLAKKAENEIHEANAVVTKLPALETKARQAKLVLKVLAAQRKSDKAGLKHNDGYQAAVTLSHRLVAEAKKDTQLAKELLKEDHAINAKALIATKQDQSKIIAADHMTARELQRLRKALATEKKNVEEDDAVLSALSPSK